MDTLKSGKTAADVAIKTEHRALVREVACINMVKGIHRLITR